MTEEDKTPSDSEESSEEEADAESVTGSGAFIAQTLRADALSTVGSLVGKVIENKYTVLEKLGEGGMGAVYKAEHQLMNRTIALKVLHPNLMENEESLRRFLHEARVASKLSHPNAVTLYDFGIENSMPYIAMEFLRGRTLKHIIAEEGPQSFERTYRILEQVGGALSEAHSLGIVHRDLKPDNIMVSTKPDGTEWVHVLDFGIAKMLGQGQDEKHTVMTRTGMFFGTPQYMSPEAVGGTLDSRSDIYSLGIILYEMISGDVPFKAPSMMQVLLKHLNEKPRPFKKFKPPLKVPKAVEQVVMKSLEKEQSDRYQSVGDLLEDLRQALGLSPSDGTGSYTRQSESRPSSIRGIVASLLFILVVGGGLLYAAVFPGKLPLGTGRQFTGATTGILRIDSNPNGAMVMLDGAVKGRTPLMLKGVPIGVHHVSLKKDGYAEVSVSLKVKPEETTPFSAALLSFSDQGAQESSPTKIAKKDEEEEKKEEDVAGVSKASVSKEAEKLYREGKRLMGRKNYLEASERFLSALEYRKGYLEAHLSLGVCFLRQQMLEKAYEQFQTALEVNRNSAPAHYNLASYYVLAGKNEKALEQLGVAIDLHPKCRRWAAEDPDFAPLRDTEAFKRLISVEQDG